MIRRALSKMLAASLIACAALCPPWAAGGSGVRARAVMSRQAGKAAQPSPAQGASPRARIRAEGSTFRGEVGQRAVELRLKRDGEKVSGAYSYDGIGKDLRLEGRIDAQGRLTLAEFDQTGKQTGKFACEAEGESDDPTPAFSCKWSRPDGRGETYAAFSEQHAAFASGVRVVSRVIEDRKHGAGASYPQLVGGGASVAAGVAKFNRQAEALVRKQVQEFVSLLDPSSAGRSSYSANYSVLHGSDDLLSVEVREDSYAGGAYPNENYFTLNYNLKTGREVSLDELFRHNTGYGEAIIKYVVAQVNRRERQLEEESARKEGRKVTPRDEPVFTAEQFAEWRAWAMTPRGLVVYFDLPHVAAYFARNFVPFGVVRDSLNPDGPAAPYAR